MKIILQNVEFFKKVIDFVQWHHSFRSFIELFKDIMYLEQFFDVKL